MKYPESTQVEAVKLVEAALSVAAWQDIFSRESLECAADYLERQVAGCRIDSANAVLEAIARHYRNEAQDSLPNASTMASEGLPSVPSSAARISE